MTPTPQTPIAPRDLVKAVAAETGVSRELAKRMIETTLTIILHAAFDGRSTMIRNFGTFYEARRAAHTRPSPANPTKRVAVPVTRRLALRSPTQRDLEE